MLITIYILIKFHQHFNYNCHLYVKLLCIRVRCIVLWIILHPKGLLDLVMDWRNRMKWMNEWRQNMSSMQQKSRCLIFKFFITSTFVMYKIIMRRAKFCCSSRTTQVVASTAATKLSSTRLVLLCCTSNLDCSMPYLSHIFTFAMVTYTSLSYYVPKQEKIQFKTITIQRI